MLSFRNMKTQNHSLIHQFGDENKGVSFPVFIVVSIVLLLLGVSIGFGASKLKKPSGTTSSDSVMVNTDKASGISDKKTFKDQAEGILKEGGIDGEGNFHLERPGGESQNVYLTSSTVDLSIYIGKKVRVWGATQQAQKAGWLMDVGLVETL